MDFFFLWKHLKEYVYAVLPRAIEYPVARHVKACSRE
jgi:hypothetical protein